MVSYNDQFELERILKDDAGKRWATYYWQLQELKEGGRGLGPTRSSNSHTRNDSLVYLVGLWTTSIDAHEATGTIGGQIAFLPTAAEVALVGNAEAGVIGPGKSAEIGEGGGRPSHSQWCGQLA